MKENMEAIERMNVEQTRLENQQLMKNETYKNKYLALAAGATKK